MSLAKALLVGIVVAYPVLVYVGLDHLDARTVALVIIAVAILRLALSRFLAARHGGFMLPRAAFLTLSAALLGVGGWVLFSHSATFLLYYPVMVNVVLFVLFFGSLFGPQSLVERIARLQNRDLPEEGVRYTRKVTVVWCGFFVVNGTMALVTALSSNLGVWAIYNSAVSYGLMGLLFAGEYIVRCHVQRRVTGHTGWRGWS